MRSELAAIIAFDHLAIIPIGSHTMATPRTITGTIVGAARLQNTVNGNPRLLVEILDDFGYSFVAKTEPDSSYAADYLNALDSLGNPREPQQRFRFHLNGRGRWGNFEKLELLEAPAYGGDVECEDGTHKFDPSTGTCAICGAYTD